MRKAPADHAADHKNIVMKGTDGYYVSSPDKNNVYKWRPVKTYEIHDNGGRPYVVHTFANRVLVYCNKYDKKTDTEIVKDKIMDFTYGKIYIGEDKPKSKWNPTSKDWGLGNSILVQKPNGTYVYIGEEIMEFSARPDDVIVAYLSPVGNNDVPYPYAIGKKFIYHMIGNAYFPIDSLKPFDIKKDVNEIYYGWNIPNDTHKAWLKCVKKLPNKVIFKRGAFY
jgi:hypothetical protein